MAYAIGQLTTEKDNYLIYCDPDWTLDILQPRSFQNTYEQENIITLYKENETFEEIATIVGCSIEYVLNTIENYLKSIRK